MTGIGVDDDILTDLNNALDQLEAWQRTVLYLDIENEFETRNEILQREVGITRQLEITKYMQRLRNKVKQLMEGTWQPKHKGNNKPTLKGF